VQGRIHCPLDRHSQVPHSPLPHPYLMYCPAWEATSRMGCPTVAMAVMVVSPVWKRTGTVPVRPVAVGSDSDDSSARVFFFFHFGW